MSKLYPLKFNPILKDKIWGGNKLKNLLHKKGAGNLAGESWELSGVQGDISVVSNGFLAGNNLQEVIEIYMGDLAGEMVYEKFGIEFPLLIKFIDATDNLSVQVHPNDEMAKERHNSYGKTEMWYILQAEPDSKLNIGFSKELTKEEYLIYLQERRLPEILNFEAVSPGDVFFMPAGRVHAIGAGILLAEIQQTSDVTYRIYDWDRVDDKGNSRELHTTLALDAIDFKYYNKYKTEYTVIPGKPSNIVSSNYFVTNMLELHKKVECDYAFLDSFVIYICLEGAFSIDYGQEEKVNVSAGETVLIPAILDIINLEPKSTSKILEVYLP